MSCEYKKRPVLFLILACSITSEDCPLHLIEGFCDMVLSILIVFAALYYVHAQCTTNGKAPFDPTLLGTTASAYGRCSPGGYTTSSRVEIRSDSLFFQPQFGSIFASSEGPVCAETIEFVYNRGRNRVMTLRHRPFVNASFFGTNVVSAQAGFPCSTVPVQTVAAWGPTRPLFIKLVRKVVNGLQGYIGQDCTNDYYGTKQSFTRKELNARLERERIVNGGISYAYNVAYANFFCV